MSDWEILILTKRMKTQFFHKNHYLCNINTRWCLTDQITILSTHMHKVYCQWGLYECGSWGWCFGHWGIIFFSCWPNRMVFVKIVFSLEIEIYTSVAHCSWILILLFCTLYHIREELKELGIFLLPTSSNGNMNKMITWISNV